MLWDWQDEEDVEEETELQHALQAALQQQDRLKLQLQASLTQTGPIAPPSLPATSATRVDISDATSLQLQAEAELVMLREEVAHLRREGYALPHISVLDAP